MGKHLGTLACAHDKQDDPDFLNGSGREDIFQVKSASAVLVYMSDVGFCVSRAGSGVAVMLKPHI